MKPTKQEADRLACTGNYREATLMYAQLGLMGQARHYLARVEGDATDRAISIERGKKPCKD